MNKRIKTKIKSLHPKLKTIARKCKNFEKAMSRKLIRNMYGSNTKPLPFIGLVAILKAANA